MFFQSKYAERVKVGEASIVNSQQFKKQFDAFTCNIFKTWKHWENMIVIGGAVVASLLPLPSSVNPDNIEEIGKYYQESYPYADIDVFFHNACNGHEFAPLAKRFVEHVLSLIAMVTIFSSLF